MRDQRPAPLGDRSPAQLGHAELGDDVVDGVLERGDHRAGRERGADARRPSRRAAVECRTMNALPPSEYIAPRAKSAWPPLDDQ